MPLRGTPGVMLKIAQCEAAGRRGVEWATMLRDELSWQDDMEEAEEGDEDADEIKRMVDFHISAQTDDDIRVLPYMVDSGRSFVIRP